MCVCIVLLNWNGWRDTIECLESIFRLSFSGYKVVICDNASTDGSLEQIKNWARGKLLAESDNPELSRLISPPVSKPISYLELTREEAISGAITSEAQLILIKNSENLGFAGGNNVALRYALHDRDIKYFWLLNNDTVVEPNALSAMEALMLQQPELGLCGSLNLSYYNPKEIQAQGGKPYSRWTARVPTLPVRMIDDSEIPPVRLDFINGSSMLVSRAFLEKVGLMEESYFLYFEELDWAMRARGKFKLGFARDSIVYHKEGATIGSHPDRMKRSLLSEKYLTRSRVLFTKRFSPWTLPSVLLTVLTAAIYRALRGDLQRANLMLSSMVDGLEAPTPGTTHI